MEIQYNKSFDSFWLKIDVHDANFRSTEKLDELITIEATNSKSKRDIEDSNSTIIQSDVTNKVNTKRTG